MTKAPSKVSSRDLYSNGKLFAEKDIPGIKQRARQYINDKHVRYKADGGKEKGRYNIVILKDPISGEERFFALYYGKKKAMQRGKQSSYALGEGAFGKVKYMQDLGTDTQPGNGEWFAFKLQRIPKNRGQERSDAEKINLTKRYEDKYAYEKEVMSKLQRSPGGVRHYETVQNQQILGFDLVGMKLIPGQDMFKALIEQPPSLSPKKWAHIARNTLLAVQDLHQNGYWHCDIKPENMMYDPKTGAVTIIDLGEAQPIYSTERKLKGTPTFMAPETVKSGIHNEKTEVYQLGQTLADIYGVRDDQGILYEDWFTLNPRFPQNHSLRDEFITLIKSMIAEDPADRPTLQNAIIAVENILMEIDHSLSFQKKADPAENVATKTHVTQQEAPSPDKNETFSPSLTIKEKRDFLKKLKDVVNDRSLWDKKVGFGLFGKLDGVQLISSLLKKVNLNNADPNVISNLHATVTALAEEKRKSIPLMGRSDKKAGLYWAASRGELRLLDEFMQKHAPAPTPVKSR